MQPSVEKRIRPLPVEVSLLELQQISTLEVILESRDGKISKELGFEDVKALEAMIDGWENSDVKRAINFAIIRYNIQVERMATQRRSAETGIEYRTPITSDQIWVALYSELEEILGNNIHIEPRQEPPRDVSRNRPRTDEATTLQSLQL